MIVQHTFIQRVKSRLTQLLSSILPAPLYRWLRYRYWPPTAWIQWEGKRQLKPVSRTFGMDRGLPLDRFYIEFFLQSNRDAIKGCVLEIGDAQYTCQYGDNRVTDSIVLHAVSGNPQATLVGNLATGEGIPNNQFDCMILTQTFLVIYDVQRAIANCFSALKSGGVLLATFPGISQISRYDMDRWGDFWRFTDASAQRLFGDQFGSENVTVCTHGNVLVACAFLQGLATEDLSPEELNYHDPDYQMMITVRAIKP